MRYTYQKYLFIIITSFVLIAFFIPKSPQAITPSTTKNTRLQKIGTGYTFSVAIDHRYHCLAQKTGTHQYQLLHIDPYTSLKKCQPVYTTGLDKQLKPDTLVGYITAITYNPNNIYLSVEVSRYPSQSICDQDTQ